jgi:hypothetical protein
VSGRQDRVDHAVAQIPAQLADGHAGLSNDASENLLENLLAVGRASVGVARLALLCVLVTARLGGPSGSVASARRPACATPPTAQPGAVEQLGAGSAHCTEGRRRCRVGAASYFGRRIGWLSGSGRGVLFVVLQEWN